MSWHQFCACAACRRLSNVFTFSLRGSVESILIGDVCTWHLRTICAYDRGRILGIWSTYCTRATACCGRGAQRYSKQKNVSWDCSFNQIYTAARLPELVYTVHRNAESDVQDTFLGKLRAKFPIYPLSAYIAIPAVCNWSKVGVKIMNIQPPPRTSSMGISGHLRQFHVGAGCHWRRIPACSGDTRAPGVKTPR